jgi:hypothetical protein
MALFGVGMRTAQSWDVDCKESRMRVLVVMGLLLGLTACSGDLSCEELAEFEAIAELGQGERRFSAIDAEIDVHYGPQGGQHVFLAAHLSGLHVGNKRPAGEGYEPPQVNFKLSRDGVTYGEALVIDQHPMGSSLDAHVVGVPMNVGYDEAGEFTLTVEAADSCGNLAVDERVVFLSY